MKTLKRCRGINLHGNKFNMRSIIVWLMFFCLWLNSFAQQKAVEVSKTWSVISNPVFNRQSSQFSYRINPSTVILQCITTKVCDTFVIPNYRHHLSFNFDNTGQQFIFKSLAFRPKPVRPEAEGITVDLWSWKDSILKSAELYQLSAPDSLIAIDYVDINNKSIVKTDTIPWSWTSWRYVPLILKLKHKIAKRLAKKYPSSDSITVIGRVNKNQFILALHSITEPINLILTHKFKSFETLTDINPQTEYNWYTAERIEIANDKINSLLCKPEDFDSTKKYPVIISLRDSRIIGTENKDTLNTPWLYNGNITGRSGTGLYNPVLSNGMLSTACFASHGYIVLEMMSTIETGRPGPAMFDRVMHAVNYLHQFNWVDTARMGLQGQGTSAYFVNYIITQTSIFKAAQESSGQTDLTSHYGSVDGKGESMQGYYDTPGGFFGKTLWQDSAAYIWQSPVILANRIQTPLLMMHNKEDMVMPFAQSIELFTGMRRLGNRCWLLQYDSEQHTLTDNRNREDFTIRLQQFFDHYLKGNNAPIWMTRGVAARDRSDISGLQLDMEIKTPPIRGLLKKEKSNN
jgi:dipeptidyl aminopeptidase/acylaminoacyl peptidase